MNTHTDYPERAVVPPVPQLTKPTMTPEEYQNLVTVERNLNTIWQWVDELESCGAECQALRAIVASTQNTIGNMKKHFSPRS